MKMCDICKRPEISKGISTTKIAIRLVAYRLVRTDVSSPDATLDQEIIDCCDECVKKTKRVMREAFEHLLNPPKEGPK